MPPAHTITHRVQFAETDMAGVVHFANYFRMMEEAEHDFFRTLGLSVAMKHQGEEIGWPRVSVGCDYFAPARFEDELTLVLRIMRVGERSLSFEVEVLRGQTRLALGKVTSVCCHMSDAGMRSIPIPGEIREKLEGGA